MPSFQDSAFIFLLALLLFGPKKLPVLARQLGKLMGDFRRASNEFRNQMEEELRISEQADRQKQIAAIETAAPATPALDGTPSPDAQHVPPPEPTFLAESRSDYEPESEPATSLETAVPAEATAPEPIPIATSGDLTLMPPSTGLPVANTALTSFVNSIPEAPAAEPEPVRESETVHG